MPKVGQQVQASQEQGFKTENRLAINLDDAAALRDDLKQKLLAGRLKDYVQAGKDGKEAAVEFGCPITEAAVACDVLRQLTRRDSAEAARVYLYQRGAWRRLPDSVILSTHNGKPGLNSEVFDVEWEAAEAVEPGHQELWDVQENPEALEADAPLAEEVQVGDNNAGNHDDLGNELQAFRDDAPEADQVTFGDGDSVGRDLSGEVWYDPAPVPGKQRLPRTKELPVLPAPVASTYREHHERWHGCQACDLAKQRSNICLARGTVPCDVLYVGEAPGTSEDAVGEPFVGPAGQLLDIIDRRAFREWPGLRRAFMNLVACFPREAKRAGINEPDGVEIEACAERLREMVAICKPKLVVLVGQLPAKWWDRVCPARFYACETVKVMHPAAILRLDSIRQGLEAQRDVVTISAAVRKLFGTMQP